MTDNVSRELVRAIFETRDQRHNETHAAIVMLWQELVCELVQAGSLSPTALAGRLDAAGEHVQDGAQGEAARDLVERMADWTRSGTPPVAPVLTSRRWFAPGAVKPDDDP